MNTRRYSKFLASLVTSLILLSLFTSTTLAAAGAITRVSEESDGTQVNNELREQPISTDLRTSPMIFTENAGQFGSLTSLPLTATLAQTGQGYGVRSRYTLIQELSFGQATVLKAVIFVLWR